MRGMCDRVTKRDQRVWSQFSVEIIEKNECVTV
jgi:hypothetical protein